MLSTGLGSARTLTHTGRKTLFVGTSQGLYEVDGEGKQRLVLAGEIDAVSAHPRALYALGGGKIRWGPLPGEGESLQVQGEEPAPGVGDLQAWCDGSVLLAGKGEITAWNPETGETWQWASGLDGLRALALGGGEGCDDALVVAGDRLLAVRPEGARVLASGLVSPRAAALDRQGRAWVLAGEPPTLMRVQDEKTEIYARYLGDPRDIIAGIGGLLPPPNLYMANGEGTLDYVHAP